MNLKKLFYGSATFFIFSLLILYFLHPVTNLVGDLGFYLKTGELISKTFSIPSTNVFSYTNPTFPFINPNWLSEVIFYLVELLFGFNGLIILSIFLITASFGLLFRYTIRKYDYFSVLVISLFSVHILYERTEVKPELFSYLLLSLFIIILYTYRDSFTKWIYLLVPLTFFWVNLHIYFFTAFLVVFLFLLDLLITKKEKVSSQKFRTLFSVFILMGVASLINPHFLTGATYPFFVLQNYAFPVEENSNFFKAASSYTDTTFIFFEIMVAVIWISMLSMLKRMHCIDFLMAFTFTLFGFFAVRTFPLLVIGTFIPVVKACSLLLEKLYKEIPKNHVLWYQLGGFLVLSLLFTPTIKLNLQINGLGLGVNDAASDAITFLKKNAIKGPLYNNYDIGSYLSYRLYPSEKVFVDARPEAYPKSFFENTYLPLQLDPMIFTNVAKKYHFNVLLINHTDTSDGNLQHMRQLLSSEDWKMVYLNNTIVIFLKNTPENQAIIKENLITENNLRLHPDDLATKDGIRQLVNFFRNSNWKKPWLMTNLKYLEYDPTNCSALQNVAYIYQQQQNPDASIYVNNFIKTCMK